MTDELTQLLDQAAHTDDGLNKENKITIIAWGGDLDRIWPTLILSTTAAASGMEASVFFTFWGLFTVVKPGVFRRVLLRAVLWAVNLIARTSTHGSLSGIPSIHYAHWSLIDGGRRLLFLSNYDGSWESYLGDFIDKASRGLTGVWSNTVGFPVTDFLLLKGAADGDAFKRFARSEQASTSVWYSAYPDLTVQQIDRQSTFREGLASKPAGDALKRWLKTC